jgi:hypothetical protein
MPPSWFYWAIPTLGALNVLLLYVIYLLVAEMNQRIAVIELNTRKDR